MTIGGKDMNILFVCTGNTCRSPMAAALLKEKIPQLNIQSAGIFASHHNRVNKHAIEVLRKRNITLNHETQPVTEQLLHWADLILTMTTQHKQSLIVQYPNFQEKYFTLKEYASAADKEVWDKLRKAYAEYETKRSLFIKENEFKLDNAKLEAKLAIHLEENIKRIQQLEANVINYDISDPFGGDIGVYEETVKELDTYITILATKLNKLLEDE